MIRVRHAGVYLALIAACTLLSGCAEEPRPVSHGSSFTGMSPVRTRTSEPKNAPAGSGGGDDFFGEVGQGITTLFDEKGDKSDGGWQIITPFGQKIKIGKHYDGQSIFRTREGPAYRLTFKDGALVMIDIETKPGVNQLKPGTLGAPGMPGVPASPGTPAAPATPVTPGRPPAPAAAPDEGEVPRPIVPPRPREGE
jgi:hypothetical protein